METKLVQIDSLITENLQIRVAMNDECIENYAAVYRETPNELPPVIVFYDALVDSYYLADGFHRVAATRLNGSDKILAEIHEGTFDDALKFAVGANAKNGLFRTNADKRHALEVAWANWKTMLGNEPPRGETDGKPNGLPSARQLAKICCVNRDSVNNFLNALRVSVTDTPQLGKVSEKPLLCTMTGDKTPSALKPTKDHLEERKESVKALLAQGKDVNGLTIPERLLEVFHSRVPNAFLRDLSTIRSALEERRLAGDAACARFAGTAMEDLDRTIRHIKDGVAYCVCPPCRGEGSVGKGGTCPCCGGLGFQTKRQFAMNREYNESRSDNS